ncbi:hypothetical protein BZG36_01534 [Bifiguratus adelaidae]|uniref:Ergosterol biosynthetic protein 28 n=1 Tax=Bifiguratus adelaidae TaxID=1938954 RepID=A0A261Y444_9FUNG|nr:hypothetical protein BZG36_01534 [Bifiguratus adelaidae]
MSALTSLLSTLPEGNLPKWLLFVASLGIFNSVQNFVTDALSKRVYAAKPAEVTPLAGRMFATWTMSVSMIRIYAAFHINERVMYHLAIGTYSIALMHYLLELLVFRTCKFNGPFLSPFIVATTSLGWMFSQYDFYVKA